MNFAMQYMNLMFSDITESKFYTTKKCLHKYFYIGLIFSIKLFLKAKKVIAHTEQKNNKKHETKNLLYLLLVTIKQCKSCSYTQTKNQLQSTLN